MNKRHIFAAVCGAIVLAAIVFAGCPNPTPSPATTIKVTGITLADTDGNDSGNIWLKSTGSSQPSSVTLKAALEPANADDQTINWSFSPKTYIDLDEMPDGITAAVTPKAEGGPTTVTVTSGDGGFTATYTVTVLEASTYVPVESVAVTPATDISFDKTGDDPFVPATAALNAAVEPQDATVQTVTWKTTDAGIASVSTSGVVTPVAQGTAYIYAESNGDDKDGNPVESNQVKVTVTVTAAQPALLLYNQDAAPSAGTTTDLAGAWNDTTKRYTISNTDENAGLYNNTATSSPPNVSVQGATFVYLNTPITGASSITARVRITQWYGDASDTGGVIIGMMNKPDTPVNQFVGIRSGTNGNVRRYISRTSGDNSSNAYSPAITNAFDDEYILQVTRSAVANYTQLSVKDRYGVQIATQTATSSNSVVSIDPTYLGFIIARADVEISQITITDGVNTIISTPDSVPTPIVPASIQFTDPAVSGTGPDYTFTDTIAGGHAGLDLGAQVLPAGAPQDLAWTISGAGASLSATSGSTVTADFTEEGEVVVTATATGTAIKATVTITVISGSIPVTGITVSADGSKTTVMAGDGGENAAGTLQFTAAVLPGNATDKDVTWSVHGDSAGTNATTAATIDADGLLTAAASLDADANVWVFAAATDGSGVVSNGVQITVKPYAASTSQIIWQFNAGDATFANASTVRLVNGINTVRTGGNYSADSTGITLAATSSRFVVGYGTPTYNSGTKTSTTSYVTNGELNLDRKFTVTVVYGQTSPGNFEIFLQNDDTSSASSVFGSASHQQTTTIATGGTYTVTFDPATLPLNAGVTGVTIDQILAKSFIQFRTAQIITISQIIIEEVD